MQYRSPIWRGSDKDFEDIVRSCTTYSEILSHFGLENRGSNHKTLKKRINKLGIKFESIRFSIESTINKIKPLEHYLKKNFKVNSSYLKNRLIKEGIFQNKCSECEIGSTWNSKPLSLHLDHINGDPLDNRIENLRILCPNCHSQTENYCGKVHRKYSVFCIRCGGSVGTKNKTGICIKCVKKKEGINKIKFVITKNELNILLNSMSITDIANKYGISRTTVNRWLKKYDLKKKYGAAYWISKKLKSMPA